MKDHPFVRKFLEDRGFRIEVYLAIFFILFGVGQLVYLYFN